MTDTPTPGSKEAIAQGCTCPVMDNYNGKGFRYGLIKDCSVCFYINLGCPLHDKREEKAVTETTDKALDMQKLDEAIRGAGLLYDGISHPWWFEDILQAAKLYRLEKGE